MENFKNKQDFDRMKNRSYIPYILNDCLYYEFKILYDNYFWLWNFGCGKNLNLLIMQSMWLWLC